MVKPKKTSSKNKNNKKIEQSKINNFWNEVILFPGYGSVLFGWLCAIGLIVFWIFARISDETMIIQTTVTNKADSTASSIEQVMAVGMSFLVILLMFVAIWIYVSKWIKYGVVWLARVLGVRSKNYWSYCTGLLVIAWLVVVGTSYFVGDESFYIGCLFVSASFIAIGSASFGIASLKKLTVPYADAKKKIK